MFGLGPQIKIQKNYFLTQRKNGLYLVKLAEEASFGYHLIAFFAHYKIKTESFKTMFTITRFISRFFFINFTFTGEKEIVR